MRARQIKNRSFSYVITDVVISKIRSHKFKIYFRHTFCKFLLLKDADVFDVQKLNYFPIRDFHRTPRIGELLLELCDEFFQFYDIKFFLQNIHIRGA